MNRVLAPAILALAFAAAPASAETRNLSGFTGVQARDGVEVVIGMGEHYRVEVTGSDAARVRTVVDGNTLKISQQNRSWWGGTRDLDVIIHVTVPRIDDISAARGAAVRAANITAHDMSVAAAMGGMVEISGSCSDLDASAAMGGVIEADGFRCQNADVSASMGGVIEVYASNTYDASAAMGGNIDIAGGASGDSSSAMGGVISATN